MAENGLYKQDAPGKRRQAKRWTRDIAEFGRLRDRVILTLLRETDIRPDEIAALTVESYDRARARLEPEPGRYVLFNSFAAHALAEYLEALEAYEPPEAEAPLFPDERGGFLSESHCWNLIREKLRGVAASARAGPRSEQSEKKRPPAH
jgi:site-specific recombinase XerD